MALRRATLAAFALLAVAGPGTRPAPARADDEAPADEVGVRSLAPLLRRRPALLEAPLPGPDLGELAWGQGARPDDEEDDDEDAPRPGAPPLLVERLREGRARIVPALGGLALVGPLSSAERADVEALLAHATEAVLLEVELDSPWGQGRLSTTVRPGQVARLGGAFVEARLRDYEPELACDNSGGWRPSALGNPVTYADAAGWGADLRPFRIPGSNDLALEVLLVAGGPVAPPSRLTAAPWSLGLLELPEGASALLLGSGRVAPGGTLALAARLGDERVSARVRARLVGRDRPAGEAPRLTRADADLLLAPPWTAERADDPYAGYGDAPRLSQVLVLSVGEAAAAPGDLGPLLCDGSALAADVARGGLDLLGRPEDRRAALARLAEEAAPHARAVRLRLTWRAGGAAPGQTLGEADLSLLVGRTVALRLGRARGVLLDHDTEVG